MNGDEGHLILCRTEEDRDTSILESLDIGHEADTFVQDANDEDDDDEDDADDDDDDDDEDDRERSNSDRQQQ